MSLHRVSSMESWEQVREEYGANVGNTQHQKMSFNPLLDQGIPAGEQIKSEMPTETSHLKRMCKELMLFGRPVA